MYIFVALCNFAFQIYIAAANLRKFEKKMQTVGNGGTEMVAISQIL